MSPNGTLTILHEPPTSHLREKDKAFPINASRSEGPLLFMLYMMYKYGEVRGSVLCKCGLQRHIV